MPEVKRSFYNTFRHPFDLKHLDEVSCNFCGSGRYSLVTKEYEFEVRECRDCGLVYVSPQPAYEELPKFYEDMYPDATEKEVSARSLGMHEKLLRRILVRRCPGGGRLMDAGCGFGLFLETIDDLPWELSAIEVSETAANHARELVPRADIQIATLEEAQVEPGSKDCVTCVAVLEHVKDPRATLTRFSEWLAPGGLLVVQVPYVIPALKLGKWIPGVAIFFEAPHHLYDFRPKALRAYYQELGYTDIRVDITPPYASATRIGLAAIWLVKAFGRILRTLSGGRYIFPLVGSYVIHATKPAASDHEAS